MKIVIEGYPSPMHVYFRRSERTTSAVLKQGEKEYVAASKCAAGDFPVKAIGRRTALTHLLRRYFPIELDRPLRRAIWQAYFTQHSDLRKRA